MFLQPWVERGAGACGAFPTAAAAKCSLSPPAPQKAGAWGAGLAGRARGLCAVLERHVPGAGNFRSSFILLFVFCGVFLISSEKCPWRAPKNHSLAWGAA